MKKIILLLMVCLLLQGCVGSFISGLNPFSSKGSSSASALKKNPRLNRQIRRLHSEEQPIKSEELIEAERKVLYALGKKIEDIDTLADKIETPPESKKEIKNELDTAGLLHDGLTTSLGMPSDKNIDKKIKSPNYLVKKLRSEVKKYRKNELKWENNQRILHVRVNELKAMVAVLQSEKQEKTLWQKLMGLGWWFIIISAIVFILVPGGPMIVGRVWSKLGEGFMKITKQGIKAGGQLSRALGKHMEKLNEDERKKLKDSLKVNMDKDVQEYWDRVKEGEHPLNEIVDTMPKGAKKRYDRKNGNNK